MISIDLDQLAARTKQDHGPKLRIHAAPEDQFVAFDPHHGLDGNAQELVRTGFFCDGRLYPAKSGSYRLIVLQVQLDAADIGLVRDRLGEHLQYDGITNLRCVFHGFVFVLGGSGFDRRNSVIRQDLFRFEFCEEHSPSAPGLIDDLCRAALRGALGRQRFHQRRSFVETAQVIAIAPHVRKCAGGGVGKGKRRNARGIENSLS